MTSPADRTPGPERRGIAVLARDTATYGVGTIAIRAIPIILVPVFTKMLSTSSYGVLDLDMSLMYLALVAMAFGLDMAVWRFYFDAEGEDQRRSILVSAIAVQLLASGVFVVLLTLTTPLWVAGLTGQGGQSENVAVFLAGVPFASATVTLAAMLRARFLARRYNLLAMCQFTAMVGGTLIGIAAGHRSITGIAAGTTAGNLLGFAVGAVLVRDDLRGAVRRIWVNRLLRYGLPLVPASVALWLLPLSGRFIVAHLRSTEDVALLALAFRLAALLTIAVGAFQTAWGPFSVSIMKQADARAVYARVLTLSLAGAATLAVGLCVLAHPLIRLVATPAYDGAAPLVPWLAFGVVCNAAYYVTSVGATVMKRPVIIATALLFSASVSIVAGIFLTVAMGAEGAAMGAFLGLTLSAYLPHRMIRRTYHVPFSLRDVAPLLVVAGVIAYVGSRLALHPVSADLAARGTLLVAYSGIALLWGRHVGVLPRARQLFMERLRPIRQAPVNDATCDPTI